MWLFIYPLHPCHLNFQFVKAMAIVQHCYLIINIWQPEGHGGAGWRHHHVLWVELEENDQLNEESESQLWTTDQDTLNCALVVSVENAHFLSILCVPYVDSTVRWTTDKKRQMWKFSWHKDLINWTWSRTGSLGKRRPQEAGFSSWDGPWTTVTALIKSLCKVLLVL